MASSRPDSGTRVLLGATGGIAVVKVPQVVSILKKKGCDVRVVMTPAAAQFVTPLALESLTGSPVGLDMFTREHPGEIQHISWAQWADAALVAPATANTLAKMANGLADNLLTSMLLAMRCPVAVCPSMNTQMYLHRATQASLGTLRNRGVLVIEPDSGHLACGDEGKGRLPEPADIVERFLPLARPCQGRLRGKRVLVTAGPTQEPLDPVRYLTNRSSGKMGYALAKAALDAGADVTLVSGPVDLEPPAGCETVRVRTALEMETAVLDRAGEQDIIIGCAAVSDYRPAKVSERKMKKAETLTVRLVENPDILARLGADKRFYLAGFAAETNDVDAYAREKLARKRLDMIVANDVSRTDIAFGSDDNAVAVYRPGQEPVLLGKAPKARIAGAILGLIADDIGA